MGPNTLVPRMISSRTLVLRYSPMVVSAPPRLYTSAVSMKLMPEARASSKHRNVDCFSTVWPKVSQLPMETTEICRPEFPSCRVVMMRSKSEGQIQTEDILSKASRLEKDSIRCVAMSLWAHRDFNNAVLSG